MEGENREKKAPQAGIHVILASGSPRRRALLEKMGVSFEVDVSEADENARGTPGDMVAELARRKARAVAARRKKGLIVAADTLVALDGNALGKPESADQARRMLSALSARAHDVFTGVCVLDAADGREKVFTERSRVRFRALSREEIDEYIATGEPMDKAGAYAIQGLGGRLVDGYEGSLTNIIGLPVERLKEVLDEMAR